MPSRRPARIPVAVPGGRLCNRFIGSRRTPSRKVIANSSLGESNPQVEPYATRRARHRPASANQRRARRWLHSGNSNHELDRVARGCEHLKPPRLVWWLKVSEVVAIGRLWPDQNAGVLPLRCPISAPAVSLVQTWDPPCLGPAGHGVAHVIDEDAAVTCRPLLTISDVADRLGVSERFVRRLVLERRIPFLKIGRFVRFDPDEIEQWIDSRHVVRLEVG